MKAGYLRVTLLDQNSSQEGLNEVVKSIHLLSAVVSSLVVWVEM